VVRAPGRCGTARRPAAPDGPRAMARLGRFLLARACRGPLRAPVPGLEGWRGQGRVFDPRCASPDPPLTALAVLPLPVASLRQRDFGEPDYASEASTNLKRGDEALRSASTRWRRSTTST
jgi:hypothetical protein